MKQFALDNIYKTTEATDAFPAGTVVGKVGTEYYLWEPPYSKEFSDVTIWPKTLFRDYWKFACDSEESLGKMFVDLINVPKQELKRG
jgi:hypothetical protein